MRERFRIDDAYGAVYEYDEDSNAYIFCGKFHTFGITPVMSEAKQIKKITDAIDEN